jgi:hypothetical protein
MTIEETGLVPEARVYTCQECGRYPEPGEVWRLLFADLGEVAIYCPECAEREFGQFAGELAR